MPYGMHWEWRGFGLLEPADQDRIASLPLAYPTGRAVTDTYLWTPATGVNIKLRSWGAGRSLKFKRLLEADAESAVELWIERVEDDHPFPLERPAVARLSRELNVHLESVGEYTSYDALLEQLHETHVHLVTVKKSRLLFRWQSAGANAFVEVGRIESPERLDTVGIEDAMRLTGDSTPEIVAAARDVVLEARTALGLPATLSTCNYVEAIAVWAKGQGLSPPP